MMTDYGIPVWGSYVIFAVATILLGLFIGLVSTPAYCLLCASYCNHCFALCNVWYSSLTYPYLNSGIAKGGFGG